ncbi:MAG TPA: MFS transporter [Pseudonocardiaceae bacterium]|jgi:MFS family permease|nr:MFS transporter [Pseudonocardiaceae bacterium]
MADRDLTSEVPGGELPGDEADVVLTTPKRPVSARAASRARFAVNVVFVIHGVLFSSWTAHVPQIKALLDLSDSQLGLALLGAPVGSVTATLLIGPILAKVGSRRAVRIAAVGYCVAGVLVGVARSLPELFAALAIWGLFQGALDVSMNTQAITVEQALGRPIMGKLHGSWSIGSLAGAGAGVIAVAAGITLTWQLLVLGALAVVVGVVLIARLLDDAVVRRAPRGRRRRRPPSAVLLVLGAIAFAGLLAEGGTADWAAVYLRDSLHVLPAVAGLGYTAFALTMVIVRLAGARLLRNHTPRAVISVCAAIATVGMTAALIIGNPVVAIIGFALLGIGLASMVPMLFSAAGNQPNTAPGTAVATVSSVGWIGFMVGPPLIGLIAGHFSLSLALGIFPLLTAFVAILVPKVPALDRARPTTEE